MSCLRCNTQLLVKLLCSKGPGLHAPFLQQVRGVKPRWLPKSKSKIFYVRKPTPIDPEEAKELRTLYNNYRTKLKALRRFIYDDNIRLKTLAVQQKTTQEDLAADLQWMEQETKNWNERVAVIREEWQALQAKKHEDAIKRKIETHQNKQLHQMQAAEEKIKQDIEESQTFITMENLDLEIEKVLNMCSDFDFAIDKKGNKVEGTHIAERGNTKNVSSSEQAQATQA